MRYEVVKCGTSTASALLQYAVEYVDVKSNEKLVHTDIRNQTSQAFGFPFLSDLSVGRMNDTIIASDDLLPIIPVILYPQLFQKLRL